MRRLRYNVAMSLDGYIAGPRGEYDWITMDPAVDFHALFSEFDCFVMGRKTFETLRAMGPEDPTSGREVIVCSSTLRPEDHPGISIVSDGAADTILELKAKPGKDIWLFGGGALFRSLLDSGTVDTVEVAIMPILLGRGIPLLPTGQSSHRLRLVNNRVLSSGIVMLSYIVEL